MTPKVHEILNETLAKHRLPILRVIETGVSDTLDIASWVSDHEDTTFDTADLNSNAQEENHNLLEDYDHAVFCTFHTQDHKKYLNDLKWVDIAFLGPDSLQDGLEEFQLAASAGASTIVIRNYQTAAASAVKQAKRFGWTVTYKGDYAIISRIS
jgi:hypothetical protein